MKYNKLVNIISIAKGRKHLLTESPSKSSKRLIVIDDLRNDKNIKYTDDKQGTNVDEKDLLIAWDGANAGTIGYGKTGFIGSTIARLRIKDPKKYYTPFLGKFLQGKFIYLRRSATGATIPHINRKALEIIKFPAFDYEDQIRIAILLSRIESLIAKRKESIRLLDELPKSTFLEMFHILNSRNEFNKESTLGDVAEVMSGITKGKKYKNKNTVTVPYLRVANVQDGYIDISELKEIQATEEEVFKYQLQEDDLLLTEGGDPDKLGRGAVWKFHIPNCIYQNHLFRVRLKNHEIIPIYLSALIGSIYGKKYFLKAAKQTTGIATINSKQLKKFPIIKPPIALQNKFAQIVEKVESIKYKYEVSLKELENLYGSLSQRAFRGELDLSNVPIDTAVKPETIDAKLESHVPEVETTKRFSEMELLKIIKLKSGQSFNFDELWNRLDASSFEEQPQYDDVKKMIFNMLAGKNPLVSQSFDKQSKEIVLRVNI